MAEPRFAGGKSFVKIALEVALIAIGVFLGLMGEQWRERTEHRELAEATLRRFRTEIQANQKAVAGVQDYHATTATSLREYFAADPKRRSKVSVKIHGLQPAFFEHTAWDLALATQSLTYIDSDLAFSLSRLYGIQQNYAELTRGILQAMYLLPVRDNFAAFASAAETYFADIVLIEPELRTEYDALLPRIDHALGQRGALP